MSETRAQFERYFAESRKSKGAGKRPTFARLPDDTYADDHTQRHWWTWQQAVAQLRDYAAERVEAAPDLSGLAWALHAGGLGTEQSRKVHMFFDTEEQARAFVEWCQLKIGKLGPNSEVLQVQR